MGDVSKLVGSADGLPELLRMVHGSHLSDETVHITAIWQEGQDMRRGWLVQQLDTLRDIQQVTA